MWRPPVGAGAETEAERHSQAKDNAVCVLGVLPTCQALDSMLYVHLLLQYSQWLYEIINTFILIF